MSDLEKAKEIAEEIMGVGQTIPITCMISMPSAEPILTKYKNGKISLAKAASELNLIAIKRDFLSCDSSLTLAKAYQLEIERVAALQSEVASLREAVVAAEELIARRADELDDNETSWDVWLVKYACPSPRHTPAKTTGGG